MIIALNRKSAQSDNKRAAARNFEFRLPVLVAAATVAGISPARPGRRGDRGGNFDLRSLVNIYIIKTAFAPAE
jgi:hypothetical protein